MSISIFEINQNQSTNWSLLNPILLRKRGIYLKITFIIWDLVMKVMILRNGAAFRWIMKVIWFHWILTSQLFNYQMNQLNISPTSLNLNFFTHYSSHRTEMWQIYTFYPIWGSYQWFLEKNFKIQHCFKILYCFQTSYIWNWKMSITTVYSFLFMLINFCWIQ